MKLTPSSLEEMVREVLRLQEQEAEQDHSKLTTTSMGGASFATSGKEQRKAANPELSNLERGIVQQVDQFLLDLAELPGVELNNKKAIIKRVMSMLQKQIAGSSVPPAAEG